MRYIILLICFTSALFSLQLYANATKELESSFATALVLTDGDSITLGYGSFDPKNFFDSSDKPDNSSDLIDLRHQLSLYSIPYDYELTEQIFDYISTLHSQVSYLKQKQNIRFFDDVIADSDTDSMHSAMLGLSIEKPISSKWFYRLRINTHLMHFENQYNYNSEQSLAKVKPLFEGLYTNIQSNALVLNPNASLIYRLPRNWGYYEYKLKFSYYYGWALSQPEQLDPVRPESWQTNNTIKANFNMFKVFDFQQSFYLKAQRVDLGADSRTPLGTDHFYEYGFGVLWDISNWTKWLDNFGIGVNINNGSSLDGGTIVIYFNEI
ncbi:MULTISPECIES: Solitary outer membrane autotransporter beta-barrel domain [unclassified Pseudoalteromonas]|uniref:Solitary outer membrane autotransporter beta-barrel domain n=1 Tax=unclassified Pseudoalteromonas TaxID=194690 RepID=UPI0025B55A2F|nr:MULTISPECIES: Solitary outer membrane autotransporter beta-barrel domain [unclassified Pseudoalteromonas]MDN3379849.1 Solitary outer membrane autotransporter beta-barrel domain [Pseudoalteromonas sp. APC 3893]MDN3388189.1 Solitary outer membrane autotransporter beta-barrel domain [Pseudoalteromonas sp. APC 4017]